MKKLQSKKKGKSRNKRAKQPVDVYVAIKKAFENPKYRYRTIDGVIKEADVSLNDVSKVIFEHPEEFVVLLRAGPNGQKLITTREHYNKKASIQEKIMGAVLNRVY